MNICLNCGAVGKLYETDDNVNYFNEISQLHTHCPKCNKELTDIDEEILGIIFSLNKLGYKTTYSCAGHYYENFEGAYIAFDKRYPEIRQWCKKYEEKSSITLEKVYLYKTKGDAYCGLVDKNDPIIDTLKLKYVNQAYIIRFENKYRDIDNDGILTIKHLTNPNIKHMRALVEYLSSCHNKNMK